MASEETPLLLKPIVPTETGLEPKSYFWITLTLPYLTIRRSWFSILWIFLSYVVCVITNYTNWRIFDPLIFKSLFVVFGFAIGFRNVRANNRRAAALDSLIEFFGAGWSILVMFPDEARAKVRKELVCLCHALANHVTLVATRSSYLAVVGLQPSKKPASNILGDSVFEWPEVVSETTLSPRAFMISFLLMCEDEIDQLEPKNGPSQKLHRALWMEKATMVRSYDCLVQFAMPAISDWFLMLTESVLCVFGVALPWGIKADVVDLRRIGTLFYLPAALWLAINTSLVILVLFGLNTLAAAHENPFGVENEDLDICKFAKLFETAVTGYETQRSACREQNHRTFSSILEEHRFMCAAPDSKTTV